MYEKILVAVDGSDNALVALEHAAPLARAFKSKLLVLNVVDDEWDADDRQATAKKIVGEQIGAAALDGVETVPLVGFGDPAERIVEVADDHDVQLIVVGSRGLSGFRSFLLGSVSYKVARSAHRPVLVVHQDETD